MLNINLLKKLRFCAFESYFSLTTILQVNADQLFPPRVSGLHPSPVPEENLCTLVERGFYGRISFCQSNISVKPWKEYTALIHNLTPLCISSWRMKWRERSPAWGWGTPFPSFPLVHSIPHLLLFHFFPSFCHSLYLFTIIFLPCGFFLSSIYLSSFFYSSPNLSGHRLDVYHTSTHGVALVRI